MKSAKGKGFLLVLMDCPPYLEDEFNAWYDTEHIPERLAIPGFETGLRFVCLEGHPRYLAMYDLERPEVLKSAAYLKVGHDKASPWTKRVTSRVRVWRSAGLQVYPGNLVTRRAPRVTLLRFRGRTADAESEIVKAVRATFEDRPETLQARVLAFETAGGVDYLVFVESRAAMAGQLDLAPFGRHAEALDMLNVYAPIEPGRSIQR